MTTVAKRQYTNFGEATLSAGISASQTTIAWTAVTALPAYGPFWGMIYNSTDYSAPGDDPDVEVIDVTDINVGAKTGTIERGKQDTTGVAHNTGGKTYTFQLGMTALDAGRGHVIDADLDLRCSTSIADNAALIQAGIDYLTANGGGVIQFGAGTYDYATTLELEASVTLQGLGTGATALDYTASTGNGCEWQANPTRSGLRDLRLITSGAGAGWAIASTAATLDQVSVENVYISGYEKGIDLGHTSSWLKLDRVDIYGTGTGVSGSIGLDVGAAGTPIATNVICSNVETPIKLSGGPIMAIGKKGTITDGGSYLASSIVVGDEIHVGASADADSDVTFGDVTVADTLTADVLSVGASARHTIASGVIALTQTYVELYGLDHGAGAADDLDSATGHAEGEVYVFRLDDSQSGNITIKHDITKINTKTGADVTLSSVRDRFLCMSTGSLLVEM